MIEEKQTKNFKEDLDFTWEKNVESIKSDVHSFVFNHPYYCGGIGMTDDEAIHKTLDDLNVPRII